MALAANQQTIVSQADRQAVLREYRAISKNWMRKQWLQSQNRYKLDAAKRLKDDADANRILNDAQLRQYIAASSVIHCLDGWSYLGRAIDATLKGDSATACHLAYYAELRAAMSLLAAEGIGVFNNKHYIVDKHSRCAKVPRPPKSHNNGIPQGTHVFAWEALEHWGSTNSAATLVFGVIAPGGLPLSEWMDRFSILVGNRSILAGHWLMQWGVDLKRFSDDRDARNISSYRPTTFSSAGALKPCASINSIKEIWRIYEPSHSYRFATLDRYLLKSSLEFYFHHTHGSHRTVRQAKAMYKRHIGAMLHELAPRDTSVNWLDFLTSNLGNSLQLFKDAKGTAEPTEPMHQVQVSARAALLLRIATGASQALLASLPADSAHLHFWWSQVGLDRCLWHVGAEPSQFVDLWADIHDSIEEVEQWCSGGDEVSRSYQRLWLEKATPTSTLGTCERVALWGLGL